MFKRIFLLLVSFFIVFTAKSYASENFSTDYNVTYTINKNASTHVNLNIAIANHTDQYYTPTYSIQVGFKQISNLGASDEEGGLTPEITKDTKGNSIKVTFNKRVVGIGNKHTLNISFDTSEVAQDLNHVWEINIPGLSDKNDFTSFNTTVIYPSALGSPAYIKPNVFPLIDNVGNRLHFTKDQLGTSGISITFGSYQIYNFDLTYHLGNSRLFPIKTEIALPPSTNYQDVIIDELSPKPINVRTDKDGNWLAQYYLSPSKNLNVIAKGKVKINLLPKAEDLSSQDIQEYLKQNSYWDTQNSKIKNLATDLKTPKQIYNYIVRNLNYDFSRVSTEKPRLGALGVLENPSSAVCLEFTDLFIALSRAAGIPAREINGFAYTQNTKERPLSLVKDILHAWPEYYDFDKKTWIMVDPTWGNTTGGVDYFDTLDFDHFAFVVKGESSTYPLSAGGYKLLVDKNSKDVNVNLGDDFKPKVNLDPEISILDPVIGGFAPDLSLKLTNNGNTLSPTSNLKLSTGFLTPKEQTIYFSKIPPFGSSEITIRFNKTNPLTNAKDTIKIAFDNKAYAKEVNILPIFLTKWFLLGGVIFAILSLTISLVAFFSWRLYFSRR